MIYSNTIKFNDYRKYTVKFRNLKKLEYFIYKDHKNLTDCGLINL